MKKEHNITTSIILSFLILSIFSIFMIIIIYVLYTRGEGRDYSLYTYFLYSLIFYKNYIPYIISLCVYFSFFKAKYLHQESISKVIAIPIATIVVLVCFYALYDYCFTNFLISNLREHNNVRDAKIYYENVFSKMIDGQYSADISAQKRELEKLKKQIQTEKIEYNKY